MRGYFVSRAAQAALHSGVRLVLSNSAVGWLPLETRAPQAHFYHGTYRGMAEAVRTQIPYRGYLKTKWWESMILERCSGRGKVCLANSEQTQTEVDEFFGLPSDVVWYPLNSEQFGPGDVQTCRENVGLPLKQPVGLFVGSASPQKGINTLRSLIDRLPEVNWLLAFRGGCPPDLRSKANVRVFENAQATLVRTLFVAADFSVCPSIYEPFGYVVAESVSCGTPVIATPGGASCALLVAEPLQRLLIHHHDDVDAFESAARAVLDDRTAYRDAVLNIARPRLVDLMSPDPWWDRFAGTVGL
jgi:glycosyltransferase involved in cell wall biosynthesis